MPYNFNKCIAKILVFKIIDTVGEIASNVDESRILFVSNNILTLRSFIEYFNKKISFKTSIKAYVVQDKACLAIHSRASRRRRQKSYFRPQTKVDYHTLQCIVAATSMNAFSTMIIICY